MILPFSTMDFAEAEETDKIGRDIIKNYKASEAMPQFEDIVLEYIDQPEEVQRIKHQQEHNKWINEHLDEDKEEIVRDKQELFTEFVIANYQESDPTGDNYFPWTSIGYDYEDNALEVTMLPEEFNKKNLEQYYQIIRSVVGDDINVTISPNEFYELTGCSSRTNCSDLEAGVEIGMQGKNFPCTLGFAASFNGKDGFVTAGHCFDELADGGNPSGADAKHPENGSKIGDLEKELTVSRPASTRCDCAFVEASGVSDETFGISTDASSIGTSSLFRSIKASLGQSDSTPTGIITDASRTITTSSYRLLGLVETNIGVNNGDSGSPVFNSSGSQLLGFMVSKDPSDPTGSSLYVRADKFTTYFSGLTWDF